MLKRFVFLFILLCASMSACQAAEQFPENQESITITDALARKVTLPTTPDRIVITGKALVMVTDAAYVFPAAPDRIVGLGNAGQGASNFISLIDPEYPAKAVLENNAGAEQIAALDPDLVIMKSYLAESVGKPIEAIGIPVVYVDFETPEQYSRDLAIFGQIFQDQDRADQVIAYFSNTAEEINQVISKTGERPRVLMLYYNQKEGNAAFNVPPEAWMQTRMVEMAGGKPAWTEANLGDGWTQVTLEQIAAWDADEIFIISYLQDPAEIVADLKTDLNWEALRAAQNSQIFAFPGDLYSWDQPDTRWILGLTWLAGQLHPESFPGLDIKAEAQAFYENLYGLDPSFFDKHILPTFKGSLP